MEFLSDKYILLAITFLIYAAIQMAQMRIPNLYLKALCNPVLFTIGLMILLLTVTGISVETYNDGGQLLEFWLKPAIVALGVPLYKQLSTIRKQMIPIILAEIAGCVLGVISVVLVAKLLGASQLVILSIASKSVTTPIAMEVTSAVGGIPSITSAVVIVVGLFGGMAGFRLMRLSRINTPVAQGLSMGTAAHAFGTYRAMGVSDTHGAFASLGLTINGIFTAILTPFILDLMGML
ncbi:MAG: LrgB family protein [Bacteroidales bacterium]